MYTLAIRGILRDPPNSILARSTAISQWTNHAQKRYEQVADSDGDFNGTCKATTTNFPLDTEEGKCASYYPDITSYCCTAVGGMLEETIMQGNDTNGDGDVDASGTLEEPVCETTNYADMLDCYKYVAEMHCRSAISGPWGVCYPAHDKVDTSRSSSISSAHRVGTGPWKLILASFVIGTVLETISSLL